MFDSVENKSISQIVIDQIQNMIMTGKLKSGDKLPPERQLTEELGIGRPALREALKALEAIGLIESRHGQGNYIANNIENSFYKPLSLSFKLNNGNIEDILALREVIETYTSREAAVKATQQDIDKLYDIHNKMTQEIDNNKRAFFDKALHYQIAKISNNKLILDIMESISYLMDAFIDRSVSISFYRENSIEDLFTEHLHIIKAIEARDSEAAVKAMTSHLNKINIKLLKDII